MKRDFLVERQGRWFVLYAGLLDEAHAQGLKSIRTQLIQAPSPDNGQVAICFAEVTTDKGTFTGLGDASPDNVARMMTPHLIRMAECVPLSARILTRRGWKRHDEVTVGEEVLAYDIEADLCRWTPLLDVSVYGEDYETVRLQSRSFDVTCTPNHTWPIHRTGKRVHASQRVLRKTCDLVTSDKVIVAAPAEEGDSPLTPREAALLGWLATDGTVREQIVNYAGRPYGPYRRAFISQSKPQYLDELRVLVGPDGSEQVSEPRRRDFGTYVSTCLPQHKFELTAGFTRELLAKAGVDSFAELPSLVTRLNGEARLAMLDAMLKGDGALRRGHSWVFGQKAKPGVSEAFTILATLCGYALGRPRTSSVGEVPVWQVRRNRVVSANYLTVTQGEPQPVWCPTTKYGTWVMNLNGCITITGNTRAKARALRDSINVGVTALEELADSDEPAESAEAQPRAHERAAEPARQEEASFRPAPAKSPAPQPLAASGGLATPNQVRAIYSIARDQLSLAESEVDEKSVSLYGVPPAELTKKQASDLIDALKAKELKIAG
ncbi:MAG: hypothetical protein ACM3S1_08990 [Hyphomicrobiales bacterium]